MADPDIITVTVTDFDPNHQPFPSATFTYSGTDVDASGTINPPPGVVSVFELTPAADSPWTPAPLTPAPAAAWFEIDGWTITVDGTNLGNGASAGFRVSVVLDQVTYVDDPTIIMVDPPKPLPRGDRERAEHQAV